MISTRYVYAVLALLALAFAPTLANVYRQPEPPEAGRLAAEIPSLLQRFGDGLLGPHDDYFARYYFGATDFLSRDYGDLTLFGARTFDAKKVFHNPHSALSRGHELSVIRLTSIESRSRTIPVHVVEFRGREKAHVAAYVLLYDGEGVANPISFMVERMPDTLVEGRKPMTLLYASGTRDDGKKLESDLLLLLKTAVDGFWPK